MSHESQGYLGKWSDVWWWGEMSAAHTRVTTITVHQWPRGAVSTAHEDTYLVSPRRQWAPGWRCWPLVMLLLSTRYLNYVVSPIARREDVMQPSGAAPAPRAAAAPAGAAAAAAVGGCAGWHEKDVHHGCIRRWPLTHHALQTLQEGTATVSVSLSLSLSLSHFFVSIYLFYILLYFI